MPSVDELVARYVGQSVPVSWNVGFVVLSYVVSFLGAGSTLELINRRTSIKGLYNHFLLGGAAISMGGIAIWSMHFIAYRAIVLVDGQPELQIAFSAGITTASFFVPILVLLLAFLAVSSSDGVKWWRVLLAGSLSGGAICGMHYLGDAAISNYHCEYVTANVVGAVVIAVSASIIALSLFFVFRASWTNSWLRRAGCMVLLSVGITSMHWCASLGTTYIMLDTVMGDSDSDSRNTTAIVVVCLAVAASFILIFIAVLSARTMRRYASKAQQIVLAVAVFDRHGRILVSPEGLLPSETVTETFPQKSHDDAFTTAHPLFHWMFRASRNWSSISALLPWMLSHLESLARGTRGLRSRTKLIEENGQLVENYDIIFRELFCLAAETLASRMAGNIHDVGRLWGEIFHMGTEANAASIRMSATFDVVVDKATAGMGGSSKQDGMVNISKLEKGLAHRNHHHHHRQDGYGRGSLMFLVRHVESPSDVARLEGAGYRFADTHRVADIIQSSMQIKTRRLEEKLREMAQSSDLDGMLEPGVHVGIFAVRARLDNHGFDVMVDSDTRSTLPTGKLPYKQLEPWQRNMLAHLEGLPVHKLLIRLATLSGGNLKDGGSSARELEFASHLRTAITRLWSRLDDPALDGATLSAKVVELPCLFVDDSTRSSATTCSLVTLQLVLNINSRVRSRKCDLIPLQFFKVHQLARDSTTHHAAFSRALHREMSAMMAYLPSTSTTPSESLSSSSKRRSGGGGGGGAGGSSKRSHSHSSSTINLNRPDSSSGRTSPIDEDSIEPMAPSSSTTQQQPQPQSQKPSLFGGIMVSQEIAIEVADAVKPSPSSAHNPNNNNNIATRLQTVPAKTRGLLRKSSLLKVDTTSRQRQRNMAVEMRRVKTPTMAALTGASAFDFNVEAFEKKDDDQDATNTFVDELFSACVESIRA